MSISEKTASITEILTAAGRTHWRERKAVLDAAAARIILQTFLDTRRHERT